MEMVGIGTLNLFLLLDKVENHTILHARNTHTHTYAHILTHAPYAHNSRLDIGAAGSPRPKLQ